MLTSTLAFAATAPPVSTVIPNPQLKVSVSPPTLPADGGAYHSLFVEIQTTKGDPLAAPKNVTVTLTSSVLEVGYVDPSVVIPEGQTYAVAVFYTTLTAGVTNITATASGVMASAVKVTTVSPSGSAIKLGVFPTPPTLLPQIGSSGKVFVQILDAGGKPARAPATLDVAVASSNPNVADVTQVVVIHKGQTYGTGTTTVGFTSGTTTITASASGLATGFAQMTVEGQNPFKLYVKVAPDLLAPSTGEQALVAVQLQSQDGTPTPAPQDILVHITSSNTTVGVVVGSDITVSSGKSYAITGFLALSRGTSVISATTQSYASGFTSVSVVKAGNTAKGGRLALIPALPVVLPDRETYMVMVGQVRNSTGSPSYSSGNVIMSLASSNTFVGTTDALLTVRAGKTFTAAAFYSTLAPGVTNITASASNYVSTSATMTSAGPIPSSIAVIPGPSILIANGSSYPTTAVQLQDARGIPAKAPTDITVTLTSSSTEVGDVSRAVTISAGTANAFVTFTSTLTAGGTTITATAPGYSSGQAVLTTIPPAQSRLAVFSDPQLLPADGMEHPSLMVQLQDPNNLPAKADLPVNVSLVSSNPTVIGVEPVVQIPVGATFAVANLTLANTNGTATITAQASGLVSASLSIKSLVLPLRANLRPASTAPALTLTPVKVLLNVTSGPFPIPDAKVVWSTDSRSAKITSSTTRTDAGGGASAMVNFADAGNVTVSVEITKGGYGQRFVSTKVVVRSQLLVLSVIPDSTSVSSGSRTNITATLTSAGKPVPGVPVTWSSTAGTVDPPVGITDTQGNTKTTFKAGATGLTNVTASAEAVGYTSAAQVTQISVGGASNQLGLVVPIVVVAVIAVVGFFLARRTGLLSRLTKREPKAEVATADEEAEGEEEGEE